MKKIPYSNVRSSIKIGDVIGCRGGGFISRIIRKLKGGDWDFSHVAIIIRDVNDGGRVEVLEALFDGGMQRNYLSRIYEVEHGKLFWLNLNCDETEQKTIIDLGTQVGGKKYDFKTTFMAVFSPIFVDAQKFNCSEVAWYLLTESGKFLKRFDSRLRQIAPSPGDLPTWTGVDPIELKMC